jgi:hypothetical protein
LPFVGVSSIVRSFATAGKPSAFDRERRNAMGLKRSGALLAARVRTL